MNLEEIHTLCVSFPFTTESFPFDEQTLVFKVGGKMFLLIDSLDPIEITIKTDPEKAIEYRESFFGVKDGYHMNHKYWITVLLDSDVSAKLLKQMIQDSYQLVFNGLTKKLKNELTNR